MGRHRLHRTRPRHAAPRGPGRGTAGRRIAAPASVAAALLVGLPGGPAIAAEPSDETPPPAVDGLGSAVGTLIGTDRGSERAEPAPATAAGLAGMAQQPARTGTTARTGTAKSGTSAKTGTAGADAAAEAKGSEATAAQAEVAPAGAGATRVTLQEKNSSGVSGRATVDARRVVATAKGMDPNARYVSFFYGATSSATNNNPCILDGTNPLPSNQTVGEWDVDENGNGRLSAPNPLGARYTLQAGTMSIRKVEHDFSKATALPVNPASYSLVACGEVQRIAVLDPVTSMVPKLPKLPKVAPLS